MTKRTSFLNLSLFVFCLSLLSSCVDSNKDKGNAVTLSLTSEPKTLNPILGAGDAYSRQVFSYHIFSVLSEIDPFTQERTPVLAKNNAEVKEITEGANKGAVSYTYEILDEAVWDNGSPVTGNDFVFSLKTIMNPKLTNLYRSYYDDFIKNVEVDAANPKRFTVITSRPYILADNAISSVPFIPEYVYDAKGLMKSVSLSDLLDKKQAASIAANPNLDEFAKIFTENFNREKDRVSGCGPYQLEVWETGSKVVLSKKKNHWTAKFNGSRSFLTANPDILEYRVYASPAAAMTDLKAGKLDIMAQLPNNDFNQLKADANFNAQYNFFTPKTNYITGIQINTRRPKVADLKVRQAVSHLLNVQEIIKTLYSGLAAPNKSIITPSREYFANELPDVTYDLEKAKQLLAEAGWKDSNNNGTVDKKINGAVTELTLSFLVANRPPGTDIGQLFQNAAKQVGIGVTLDAKEAKLTKEDVKKGNFDLYYYAASQDADFDDFDQKWNSKSPDNPTGFGTVETDKLIQQINTTLDKTKRNVLYHDFQNKVAAVLPVINLTNPQDKMAISKRFKEAKATNIRPYYQEHLFK